MTTATGSEVSVSILVPGTRLVPGMVHLKRKLNQSVRRSQISAWRFDRPMWTSVGKRQWRAWVVFPDMNEAMLGKLATAGM